MGCKIIFSPPAIADLAAVVRRIARDDPQTAERIGHALIDRAAVLENFPHLGAPYPKRSGVRKLVSRPYLIFYRISPAADCVEILRYWHGARRDPFLKD